MLFWGTFFENLSLGNMAGTGSCSCPSASTARNSLPFILKGSHGGYPVSWHPFKSLPVIGAMYSPSQGAAHGQACWGLPSTQEVDPSSAIPQTRGVLILAAPASAPIDCNSCRMSPQELCRTLTGIISITQSTVLCTAYPNQCEVHAG